MSTALTARGAIAMLEPGDMLVDCTGSKSLIRDHLVPGSGAAENTRTRSSSTSSTRW